MPANKIGSYIVHYRAKKKEAAEQERQRRLDLEKRLPDIIDPSFELLGYKTPPTDQTCDDPFSRDTMALPAPMADDWVFQTRRASNPPRNCQFEPYCEVTPKSSVSSQNSAASSISAQPDYDTSQDTLSTARPRPQSYLPSSASAIYSHSMTDLHRGSNYQSRRNSTLLPSHQRQDGLASCDRAQPAQSSYRLEASLTRPFSISDPLEELSEPVRDSHLYNRTPGEDDDDEDSRLTTIHEQQECTDDLVKRGYSAW